jgi:GTPase
MFIDTVTITVKAGNGGNGAATLLRTAQTRKGGPDGGNGGNGGNVYVEGSSNVNDLREFRYHKKIIAENGVPGKKSNLFGKNASHKTILVPVGTRITNLDSPQVFEINHVGQKVLIAKGGVGGRGNAEFATPTNRTPMFAEPGGAGESKKMLFDLRIIAQIGLTGLPNAGKSSILAALTRAKPEIADYPFTTLNPNIGMMGKYAIADIPGLIEGAADGKGLGIKFLKHIEKTKILVHCLDISNENLLKSYELVRQEFAQFNPELLMKPELILLTKTDLINSDDISDKKKLFQKLNKEVYSCSIYDAKSIDLLKDILIKKII